MVKSVVHQSLLRIGEQLDVLHMVLAPITLEDLVYMLARADQAEQPWLFDIAAMGGQQYGAGAVSWRRSPVCNICQSACRRGSQHGQEP